MNFETSNDYRMASQVYGGDEINALVLDPGSYYTRAGWAGEEMPKSVVSSTVGVLSDGRIAAGDNAIQTPQRGMEMKNYFTDGVITDWDACEAVWQYSLVDRLRATPSEHPLLITEPVFNPTDVRQKMAEIAFEKYNVPAFYLAKQPVCATFALGKSTALLVDIGAQVMSVTPVYDGLVLRKAALHQPLAGNVVSECVLSQVSKPGLNPITPYYLISKRASAVEPGTPITDAVLRNSTDLGVTPSFHRWQQERVLQHFKETTCQVMETTYDETTATNRPGRLFEFPDGYQDIYSKTRFTSTEPLFSPSMLRGSALPTFSKELIGLSTMVQQSLSACDPDLRGPLLYNVLVTGGSSLIQGLTDRLMAELQIANPGAKVRVMASGNTVERTSGKWIGGSILASLGSFHSLWISRQEYDAAGKDALGALLEKRCK